MKPREIVRRAIEFRQPPRLPFCQSVVDSAPSDVLEVWEMDRAHFGWFFAAGTLVDDWGCRWERTDERNMGQVVGHPLANWNALGRYRPPDPRNPFYFERLSSCLEQAGDRYVLLTSHFALLERLHMLHGFVETMQDLALQPEKIECVLDMILAFRIEQLDELHRRCGDRVDGIFMTDDWGTQHGLFASLETFDRLFAPRYRALFDAIHHHGWHAVLHSCGKINRLVPRWIELGVDVLNMQQPRTYGLVDFGEQFRGRVCFLTTVDIQTTLPRGVQDEIRAEARELVRHWSTPDGGLIVYHYGDPEALGITREAQDWMFDEFVRLQDYWAADH